MKYLSVALYLTLAMFFIGCLESNPQPTPLGDKETKGGGDPLPSERSVDDGQIYASAVDETNTVIIVGAAGAAEGADACFGASEEEPAAGGSNADGDDGDVDEDGSFVLVIPDVAPPVIVLTFKYPDRGDIVLTLDVPAVGDDDLDETPWMATGEMGAEEPNGRPSNYDGWQNAAGAGSSGITATDLGDGTIEVRGGFLSVTPLVKMVVVNLSNDDKAVVAANVSGEFIAILSGTVGDGISLFAVNPSDSNKATIPVVLTVSE
jgi:hypothetical protein